MYSQYGEENILKKVFGDNPGFVVDIGAADGIRFSNSYWLLMRNWKGLLIEPNKKNFEKLKNIHKKTYDVTLINEAAGKKTNLDAIIYCDTNDSHEQLSTLSKNQVDKCKDLFNCGFYEQKTIVRKTSEIFENHNINKIDFLSIDTEMLDYEVLLGIDFDKVTIGLICVEHNNDDIKILLEKNNYHLYDRTHGNVFYKNNNY